MVEICLDKNILNVSQNWLRNQKTGLEELLCAARKTFNLKHFLVFQVHLKYGLIWICSKPFNHV